MIESKLDLNLLLLLWIKYNFIVTSMEGWWLCSVFQPGHKWWDLFCLSVMQKGRCQCVFDKKFGLSHNATWPVFKRRKLHNVYVRSCLGVHFTIMFLLLCQLGGKWRKLVKLHPKTMTNISLPRWRMAPLIFPPSKGGREGKKAKKGPVFSSIIEMVFSRSGH